MIAEWRRAQGNGPTAQQRREKEWVEQEMRGVEVSDGAVWQDLEERAA
jgi:hypothetical protein